MTPRVYVVTSGTYYETGESTSLHFSYAGALSEAGNWMRERDYSDPWGIATRTYYARVPIRKGELDRWQTHGDRWMTITVQGVNR